MYLATSIIYNNLLQQCINSGELPDAYGLPKTYKQDEASEKWCYRRLREDTGRLQDSDQVLATSLRSPCALGEEESLDVPVNNALEGKSLLLTCWIHSTKAPDSVVWRRSGSSVRTAISYFVFPLLQFASRFVNNRTWQTASPRDGARIKPVLWTPVLPRKSKRASTSRSRYQK
ncbi:unnamed protein product [Protopolystoma xenopodis]|uniref:Uncharacterized protein n=1 Tax=Protopolystoma xenopodis TaxID=117903 RepID=A0A3S5FD17_9PLAT|nr:unnamed protein product [Protopolystoma xenopodis]